MNNKRFSFNESKKRNGIPPPKVSPSVFSASSGLAVWNRELIILSGYHPDTYVPAV